MSSGPGVQSTSTDYADDRQRARALSRSHWWLLFVAVVTALLCAPFLHALFGAGGDEGVLLNGAERMLRGESLYVDFFEFLPPGGFVLTELWFSIAGISFVSARSLAILTIIAIACFTYLTCRQASKNSGSSAFLAIWWVVLSQGYLTQVSHHWFTTLFSMISVWAALAKVDHVQQQLRWPLIAGVATGLAAVITPHRGALVMLAAAIPFLQQQHRVHLIVYVLGCALVPIGSVAYIIDHHALKAAFDDVIRFSLDHYLSIQGTAYGYGHLTPLAYLFPATALLMVAVCAGDWATCRRDRRFWSYAAFGLAGLLGCFPRADATHITYAAPLVLPFFSYCASHLLPHWRLVWWRYRYVAAAGTGIAIGICTPSIYFFHSVIQKAITADFVRTQRGTVRVVPLEPAVPMVLKRIATMPSNDNYFFYPEARMLPFMTGREQVSKYDTFLPDYTLPSQYQDACISVMRHASWVIVDQNWLHPAQLRGIFPAMRHLEPKERKQFEQALVYNFRLVAHEGGFEFRYREKNIDENLCNRIAR